MTANEIVALRDALRSARTPLEGHWNDLAENFLPFRLSGNPAIPDIPSASEVHDSTGRRASLILANGLASLIIPREEKWFEYQPPLLLRRDDEAVKWYRSATGIAREYLEASNFYEEAQEVLIESPVFGTACLFLGDLDSRGELYFRQCPIKTYYIGEDAKGRVNCVIREYHLTAKQALEEFDEKDLPKFIVDKAGKPQSATETFEFLHAVLPRTERKKDAPETERMPWASYIVACGPTKKKVQESGYYEFPFAVHRYRRIGRCVWGFGPGSTAVGDARQLQYLNQLADVAAEKAIFPPVVAPASLEGEIGQGALEITYIDSTDPNAAYLPREWASPARFDVTEKRLFEKQDAINKAFHVDLFQLFSARAMERSPMTATEASLISGEKLTQFSPVFGRLVSELLDPLLTRLFGVLFRAGHFGPPPASVASPDQRGIAAPALLYKNRILLAMQEQENVALAQYMELISPLAKNDPDAFIHFDTEAIYRDTARNKGFPERWIRSKKEIEAMKQERAALAQEQQAAAIAKDTATAAGQLGKAPPALRAAAEAALIP